ncbi:10226_t:CDS:2, partial [Cetraspora pellucida]
VMADIQRPTGMVYPDLPRAESNLRSAMMRGLFSQREREYISYSSDIAENNHVEIEEHDNINTMETSVIVNGISRISNGVFFSDDETTSSLSELSSDHDSSLDSLDSLDNCQSSVVDASENIQSDSTSSENDRNSMFNRSKTNQKTQFNKSLTYSDSIELYYDNHETNNINGISSDELTLPSFTLPQDQASCTTPKNPESLLGLQNNNNEKCSNSVSKDKESIEREDGENGNYEAKGNLKEKYSSDNDSIYEGNEDDLPALSFIQAKIEELAKWKKDVWARLREQSESSSTPELKSENGMSTGISAYVFNLMNNYREILENGSLSTPKVETDDTSIKVQPEDESRLSTILIEQNETSLITPYHHTNEQIDSNPIFTSNESKGSNIVPYHERSEFSNRVRNESTAFSNHERNELGSFHERSDRKFFSVNERFESFLYRDSRLFFDDRYDTRPYPDDRYETFLYGNSERNDSCRFSSHERNDLGRFLNHERLDQNGPLPNRQDVDITAFHQQLPPTIKRHNEQQNPPLGPLHKRSRHMPNGFHYDPMNHGPSNGIYGPPPTGPSGMSGSGMMGRGREDQYHHYYHRNDYRPPPPYFDRQGPYGRGHMNNNISRRPIGGPPRPLSRPQERPRTWGFCDLRCFQGICIPLISR